MRLLKHLVLISTLVFFAGTLPAQNPRITHTISISGKIAPQLSRDYWFPIITNADDVGGKTIVLTVTSPKQTVVYVQLTNDTLRMLNVQPFKVTSFNIPVSWEIKSSAIAENKAIHVWSYDADLSCCMMSHWTASSEGTLILPSIGWGTDYVLAAYKARHDTIIHDQPSEFAIVADQNNTILSITPSADLRRETAQHSGDSTLAHAKGVLFFDTLQRGQTIQYKTLIARDCQNYDVTGTIVRANQPVGVMAGSQNANANCGFGAGNFVCEMMPPLQTWGKTYYTAPLASSYLIVGTKAGQVVRRYDSIAHLTTVCTLTNAYDRFSTAGNRAYRWESDTNFLLVQYFAYSSSPSEAVMEPAEQFHHSVLFQADSAIGNSAFVNTVIITVNQADLSSTTLDGKPITGLNWYGVDGKYVLLAGAIGPGAHHIESDSGVSVVIRGLGPNYENYSWTGSVGTIIYNSPDQTAPLATPSDQCFSSRIHLADSGLTQSGLLYIALDTAFNMSIHLDPNWVDGAGRPSSFYDLDVTDSSQYGAARVFVYDRAGNVTKIFSEYAPQIAEIHPIAQDFGTGDVTGKITVFAYDTLVNTGQQSFPFNPLYFGTGDSTVFSIDSIATTPLAPGERRAIKLGFRPKQQPAVFATLLFGDACTQQEVLLRGIGGTPDFSVTDADFHAVAVGTRKVDTAFVVNQSALPVTVESISIDSAEFTLAPNQLPVSVAPNTKKPLVLYFIPTSCNSISSALHATSNEVGLRSSVLHGAGDCSGVDEDTRTTGASVSIFEEGNRLSGNLIGWQPPVAFELENVLGVKVLHTSVESDTQFSLDVSGLARGIYFYRISSSREERTGKVSIVR